MDKLLKEAIAIAIDAHDGQMDRSGEPIFCHPYRVMKTVDRSNGNMLYLQIIAILHDVCEDTDLSPAEVVNQLEANYGGPLLERHKFLIEALDAITRRKDETYFDYIDRCKKNREALYVKILDVKDNTLPWRMERLGKAEREGLSRRYQKALRILQEAY